MRLEKEGLVIPPFYAYFYVLHQGNRKKCLARARSAVGDGYSEELVYLSKENTQILRVFFISRVFAIRTFFTFPLIITF